jgi:hypothetical protein
MTGSLTGVRIWLSAAVPDNASTDYEESIISFIKQFADTVFYEGGSIIHGAHPSITPQLYSVAEKYINAGRKDCLIIAASTFFAEKDGYQGKIWKDRCVVYETPKATGDSLGDESLKILRQWMCERADAFVAVAGKLKKDNPSSAGVPIEANLAIDRGLPCFLLGGSGGAVKYLIDEYPELLRSLKNGLADDTNKDIAQDNNLGSLVEKVSSQLSRLPIIRGRASNGVSFRVLALDGGGIKGAFTASVLATFEELLGETVVNSFDLIAGTSTGGILAVGLGMGLSPKEMIEFYRKHGSEIFPTNRFFSKFLGRIRHFMKPKYSSAVLAEKLKNAYHFQGNEKHLEDSLCRLVIPAYDANRGICYTFRTPHNELLQRDAKKKAWEVALATAAAPTYFKAAQVQNTISNSHFVDGGVWANCPAIAAIVEAVCYLKQPLDRIDILSIGTTREAFDVRKLTESGIIMWNKKLIDIFSNAQIDSCISSAKDLIGSPRFLRVDEYSNAGRFTIDDATKIEDLINYGCGIGAEPEILSHIKARFLNGVPAMNWK